MPLVLLQRPDADLHAVLSTLLPALLSGVPYLLLLLLIRCALLLFYSYVPSLILLQVCLLTLDFPLLSPGFSYLALFTTAAFMQHLILYFWNHYEVIAFISSSRTCIFAIPAAAFCMLWWSGLSKRGIFRCLQRLSGVLVG